MRILVLHQHYWPEVAATAQILADLCEDLALAGHEVRVVCGQPSYRQIAGQERRLPAREQHEGVTIERVWSYIPVQRGIARRVVAYASYFGSSLAAALCAGPVDVCLVMSTPPLLLGVSGTLLKLLRGVPFVYSVQDLYPDIAIHLGVLKAKSWLAQSVGLVANTCYAQAAEVVTLSPGMGRRLAEKGLAVDRIHVIPNWADTSSVSPLARDNAFAREHGLADGFVVQYAGNLGRSQGLEHVIAAAEVLRDLPITFVFAGDGGARPDLKARADARGLSNVLFLPPQPRERLSELLGACDVALVPMKRGVGEDLVPSKLYGIMAAARPVVASVEDHSEVAHVLRTHDCGHIVEPESAEGLAAGIRHLYEMPATERQRLGQNGRAACTGHFGRKALTKCYDDVLRRAAGLSQPKITRAATPRRPAANPLT